MDRGQADRSETGPETLSGTKHKNSKEPCDEWQFDEKTFYKKKSGKQQPCPPRFLLVSVATKLQTPQSPASFFLSFVVALKRSSQVPFNKQCDCEAPPKTLSVSVIFFTTVHSSQHSHVLAVWDCVSSVSSILSYRHSDGDVNSGDWNRQN